MVLRLQLGYIAAWFDATDRQTEKMTNYTDHISVMQISNNRQGFEIKHLKRGACLDIIKISGFFEQTRSRNL
jgi:hypothetical protein